MGGGKLIYFARQEQQLFKIQLFKLITISAEQTKPTISDKTADAEKHQSADLSVLFAARYSLYRKLQHDL